MPRKLRLVYFAHTLRSDWNNGNAHFLRGLLRSLKSLGHEVTAFEPEGNWSVSNLLQEADGRRSLEQFAEVYSDLDVVPYPAKEIGDENAWRTRLRETDVVIVHEWNPPELAHTLLDVRRDCGFKLLFHDTHHRASSSPEQIKLFRIPEFDGVLAFGEALRTLYRERFAVERVWTLHEAADTAVFFPQSAAERALDVVWIGNWGDGERAKEISEYLLTPAAKLRQFRFGVYGVRYPQEGLTALESCGVAYGGYLPNLSAPAVYSAAGLTVHIPRQQYSAVMTGIPTIRVFEALACGIPLISAPWKDSEGLFREGDFCWAHDAESMTSAMRELLGSPELARAQAARGLETVLARHTCMHRAEELSAICEELLH